MKKEQTTEFKFSDKSYILSIIEFIGTKDFKHMIHVELKSDTESTVFLLGIPDPALVYVNNVNIKSAAVTKKILLAANNSVIDYISNNKWEEGRIYYGEYQVNSTFQIINEKPAWEDGNWGRIL